MQASVHSEGDLLRRVGHRKTCKEGSHRIVRALFIIETLEKLNFKVETDERRELHTWR